MKLTLCTTFASNVNRTRCALYYFASKEQYEKNTIAPLRTAMVFSQINEVDELRMTEDFSKSPIYNCQIYITWLTKCAVNCDSAC